MTFLGVGHEGVNAGEVVGVEVVLIELALDWIVKLRKVILSYQLVKIFKSLEIMLLFFSIIFLFTEPLLNDRYRFLKPLNRILDVNY